MQPYLTFIHALSPLHAGTGQGVDVIDLPIARERATGLPLLPGSSLKGTLLDAYRAAQGEPEAKRLFGTTEAASKAQFTDQRLLASAADKAKIDGVTSGKALQFGGKATVGRGLCRVQIAGAQAVPPSTPGGQQ